MSLFVTESETSWILIALNNNFRGPYLPACSTTIEVVFVYGNSVFKKVNIRWASVTYCGWYFQYLLARQVARAPTPQHDKWRYIMWRFCVSAGRFSNSPTCQMPIEAITRQVYNRRNDNTSHKSLVLSPFCF